MADLFGSFGDYFIEKLIGEGGMGQVYLATDPLSRRRAAIKVMHGHLAVDARFRRRFLQEIEFTRRLVHPAIIAVWEAGETRLPDAGYPILYLIMAYAAGGNLATYLAELARTGQTLAAVAAARLVLRLAEALDYAHQRGVVHLDVKPENILLPQPADVDSAVVADFGLARLLSDDSDGTTRTFIGTPAYMSPEQLQGEAVDGRSDLFSLGVVLYQLATGRRPFAGESPVAVDRQQQAGPTAPQMLLPTISPALEEIILKAISLRPADRFQSGGDFAGALRHYLQNVADDATGAVPVAGGPAVTRLQARHWVAPVSLRDRIDLKQRWIDGRYRFFIAHQTQGTRIVNVTDDQRILKIGRNDAGNDIVLPDVHVSNNHATLERAGNGWQIIDVGSTNGTFLDKESLSPRKVHYWRGRESLRIGPYFLLWEAYDKYGLDDRQAEKVYRQEEERWNRLQRQQRFWLEPRREELLDVGLAPPAEITIKPGEQASLQVTILNREAIVEGIQVRLENIPNDWYTAPAAEQSLLAGVEKPLSVLIHPPLIGEATSGKHKCDVVVYSTIDGRERYRRRDYVIHVMPVAGHTLDMHPKNLSGAGTVQVSVLNTGNAEAAYLLQARDPAKAIVFSDSEQRLVVPPGQRQYIDFVLTPRQRRPLFSPARVLPFEIRVGPNEADLQPLGGQLTVNPRFPTWLVVVVVLAVAVLWLLAPRVASRRAAAAETGRSAQSQMAAAEATIAAAEATIAVGSTLLDSLDAEDLAGSSDALRQVAADVRQAEADKASAEADRAQAAQLQATAEAIGPIGAAIPENRPPTALTLDNNTVVEDSPPGTVVGILQAADPDDGDVHSYRLADGDGSDDNGLFSIEGSQLKTLGALDFEDREELSIRIEARDSRGGALAQRFMIVVQDVNEPPTAVALSNTSIAENAPGAFLGELATADPDPSDSFTYSIVDDPTGLFEISGSSLRLKVGAALDAEGQANPFELEIAAEDGGGNRLNETFTVTIEDGNDAPVVTSFGLPGNEDEPIPFSRANFSEYFQDQDANDALVRVKFTLLPAGGLLQVGGAPVFEGQELTVRQLDELAFVPEPDWYGRATLRWNGSDGDAYAAEDAAVTLTIIAVDDPPTFFAETATYTVDEDAGPQNFNWATDIRDPEGNQRQLQFVTCDKSNEALFSQQPHVSASSGNLTFTPAPDQNGTAEIEVVLTDRQVGNDAERAAVCASADERGAFTIQVTPVNDAPVLHCLNINMGTVIESGTEVASVHRVRSIIDAGGNECITDVDGQAFRAMAIINVQPASAWQFSTNNGNSWRDFPGDLSRTAAVLLNGDAQLRIVSAHDGQASIRFHAWDGSIGQSGDTNVNILETGDTTAFSQNVASATRVVNRENDQPQINLTNDPVNCDTTNNRAFLASGGQIMDADDMMDGSFHFDGGHFILSNINAANNSNFTLSIQSGTVNGGQIGLGTNTVIFNGVVIGLFNGGDNADLTVDLNNQATVAATTALLQRFTYQGANCQGAQVRIEFNDGGNVGFGGPMSDDKTVTAN